ncbi:Lysosomal acid glucosylceramidase [Frankliniella fusca]|uniref:Lysosomal acid glucosylceramidase n=1 Tax=Frankliniella fusca TaxID=407009 RepID=A0AAE1GVN6_9NEOP|nr:Lysosomal acid glucosylceramidase [Frankliniella fusca]
MSLTMIVWSTQRKETIVKSFNRQVRVLGGRGRVLLPCCPAALLSCCPARHMEERSLLLAAVLHCLLLLLTDCAALEGARVPAPAPQPCAPRDYGEGSVVCVCNASHCDTLPRPRPGDFPGARLYSSTKEGLRFAAADLDFTEDPPRKRGKHIADYFLRYQRLC